MLLSHSFSIIYYNEQKRKLPRKPQPKNLPPGKSGRQMICAKPGQPLTFSKSDAGCLHSGQIKSAGSYSPS